MSDFVVGDPVGDAGSDTSVNTSPSPTEPQAQPELKVPPCIVAQEVAFATEPEWIVDKLLVCGGLTILAGSAKVGRKTFIAQHLGICVANGRPFLGKAVQAMPAIYTFLEDGRARALRRFKQLGVTAADSPFLAAYFGPDSLVLTAKYVSEHKCLWIVDSLAMLARHHGVKDENDPLQMTDLLERYRPALQASGAHMLITHHFNKTGAAMRGSSAIQATCDGWLESVPAGNDIRRLSWTLRDEADGAVGVLIRKEGPRIVIIATEAPAAGESNGKAKASHRHKTAILELIVAGGPDDFWPIADLAKKLGVGPRTKSLVSALQELCDEGLLVLSGGGSGYRQGPKLRNGATN